MPAGQEGELWIKIQWQAGNQGGTGSRIPRGGGGGGGGGGEETEDPLLYLLSDSDSEASVRQIRVTDQGSVHQYAKVVVAREGKTCVTKC